MKYMEPLNNYSNIIYHIINCYQINLKASHLFIINIIKGITLKRLIMR